MPRRSRRRNNRRNDSQLHFTSSGSATTGTGRVRMFGKAVALFTISTGTQSTIVGSLNGFGNARLDEFAEAYELFRFCRLRFHIVPYNPTNFGSTIQYCALSWVPGATLPPANVSAALQLNNSYAWNNTGTSVTHHVDISRQSLMANAPNKWWRSQPNATFSDSWDSTQFTLFFNTDIATTGNASYLIQFEYELELAGAVSANMIPRPIKVPDEFIDLIRKQVSTVLSGSLRLTD